MNDDNQGPIKYGDIPEFVRQGAFNWYSKGYHYILSEYEKALMHQNSSRNIWLEIAEIVEQSKIGDFSGVGLLAKFFDYGLTTNAAPVALLLTGAMGRRQDLEKLTEVMLSGSDGFRIYACKAASIAGCLWMVPYMLKSWHACESLDAHESIGFSISDLLDPMQTLDDLGHIGSLAGNYTLGPPPQGPRREDFEKLVRHLQNGDASDQFDLAVTTLFDKLICESGREDAVVWRGKRSGVGGFTQDFLRLITADRLSPSDTALTVHLRHKFEASTGINCSAFYVDGRFQQMTAVEVLENFIDVDLSRYVDNKRYFFGHVIE